MKLPVQITFRKMETSEEMERLIRGKAAGLERYSSDIMGCRVMIETFNRGRQQGKRFHVRIDLAVPGEELVVGRDPARHAPYEDAQVAIREAFHAVRRELMDYERRRRGQIKSRTGPLRGKVVRLFPVEGYGFIRAEDGEEVYFHENSVLDGFGRLEVGDPVRFAAEKGDEGPQASTVALARGRSPSRRAS